MEVGGDDDVPSLVVGCSDREQMRVCPARCVCIGRVAASRLGASLTTRWPSTSPAADINAVYSSPPISVFFYTFHSISLAQSSSGTQKTVKSYRKIQNTYMQNTQKNTETDRLWTLFGEVCFCYEDVLTVLFFTMATFVFAYFTPLCM